MPGIEPPKLRVFFTEEHGAYVWRVADPSRTYCGSCSTPEARDEVVRRQGHTVVPDPLAQAEAAPTPPEPPRPALPPVTAETIRDAGMVPVGFADARSGRDSVRVQTLANRAFPDLEKIVRLGPGDTKQVSFTVAGQQVAASPDAIIAALDALGPRRQPPMEPRR